MCCRGKYVLVLHAVSFFDVTGGESVSCLACHHPVRDIPHTGENHVTTDDYFNSSDTRQSTPNALRKTHPPEVCTECYRKQVET